MENNQITIEGAKIIFRNFAGAATKFNAAGNRNFSVILPKDIANELAEDGWNIRYLKPRDEEEAEDPTPYLQVGVRFTSYPPKVWLVSGNKKTLLDEDTIASLDYAEIEKVDLIIRPYQWEVGAKSGIKAYLKKMFVTVVQDDLEIKYKDLGSDDDVPWEE